MEEVFFEQGEHGFGQGQVAVFGSCFEERSREVGVGVFYVEQVFEALPCFFEKGLCRVYVEVDGRIVYVFYEVVLSFQLVGKQYVFISVLPEVFVERQPEHDGARYEEIKGVKEPVGILISDACTFLFALPAIEPPEALLGQGRGRIVVGCSPVEDGVFLGFIQVVLDEQRRGDCGVTV